MSEKTRNSTIGSRGQGPRQCIGRFAGIPCAGWVVLFCSLTIVSAISRPAGCQEEVKPQRAGYLVEVPLPLVGDRDEQVRRQIRQIAEAHNDGQQADRPTIVLQFSAKPLSTVSGAPLDQLDTTRGSQFERCLALARFLTSTITARVRPVAYVPKAVEGHAVLPLLACEAIYAAPEAEIGRAAVDEPADATIKAAYMDIVRRRLILPEAVVSAMLDPNVEVYVVGLADGQTRTVTREELEQLQAAGSVVREESVWPGGGLAAFTGAELRARRWIDGLVDNPVDLPRLLGISGNLRSPLQRPQQWHAISITLTGRLTSGRANQLQRAISEQVSAESDQPVNLIVLWIDDTEVELSVAQRMAAMLASFDPERVQTVAVVRESTTGPVGLIASACRQCALVRGVEITASADNAGVLQMRSVQRSLDDLATRAQRPLPLLSVLVDPEQTVREYVHQQTGRRAVFADWQVGQQPDAEHWVVRATIASEGRIDPETALRYRLVDRIDNDPEAVLRDMGLEEVPPEISMPWLDATIQMLLSQGWLPRLLLTIGFIALMAELGNPGIGVAGFLAAVCFGGFFWIEALNGNVAMLEVLLFLGGLAALLLEIFVVPGFGIFGIGGLAMIFLSIVLASQTFIWPTTREQFHVLAVNLFWVACLALGGMIGLVLMHRHMERIPLLKWIVLTPEGDAEGDLQEKPGPREHLLGQVGITTTRLNPSGKAQFGDEIVSVVGSGRLIDEGVPVRVVEVLGNLVVVEEAADV